MPLPTVGDMHVNVPLSTMSVAFAADDPPICEQVFPVIPTAKQSDKYFIYDRADWNRVSVVPRAPGTESEGADWRLSTDTFYCDPFALHKDITFEERQNADTVLELDSDAVSFLVRQMRMKKDKAWATEFFTSSVWTGSTTGSDITVSTKWDASSSTPIKDIRAQARSIHTKTGYRPNTLVIGATTWDALVDNADFLDRIKYTQTGIVTKELLAKALDIDKVIIAELMEATSQEGDATTVTAQMFGEGALLLYVAPKPGKRVPSAGYQFRWNVAGIPNQAIKKFEITEKNCDRVEIQSFWDYKLVSSLMGVFFVDVLT